jgi:hypothetical protein
MKNIDRRGFVRRLKLKLHQELKLRLHLFILGVFNTWRFTKFSVFSDQYSFDQVLNDFNAIVKNFI